MQPSKKTIRELAASMAAAQDCGMSFYEWFQRSNIKKLTDEPEEEFWSVWNSRIEELRRLGKIPLVNYATE